MYVPVVQCGHWPDCPDRHDRHEIVMNEKHYSMPSDLLLEKDQDGLQTPRVHTSWCGLTGGEMQLNCQWHEKFTNDYWRRKRAARVHVLSPIRSNDPICSGGIVASRALLWTLCISAAHATTLQFHRVHRRILLRKTNDATILRIRGTRCTSRKGS